MTGIAKLCCSMLFGACLVAALAPERSVGDDEPEAPAFEDEPLSSAIRQAILDELKDKYEDKKNWGHTTEALRGVKIRGQGLKLRLEKRTKPVNDGLWQRYVVTVVEPERQLHVRLDKLRLTDQGRIAFALRLSAKLRGEAHIERWERGVKLLGTSAQGDATVAATIACDVGIRFDPGKVASDVLLDPHVSAISLDLIDLDVHRISKLGGKAAHELGDSFTPMVARQLKRREAKLAAKANASIAKHSDRLRLPVNAFITSGWARLQSLLPAVAPASSAPEPKAQEAAATASPATTESTAVADP
ncbi:MAG TPA: hypothetical protein VHY91_06900 [Pirellulales bacterium]|jgi:hypothetical protein|nr:hypothetical protein [Pirellulales bacterium]